MPIKADDGTPGICKLDGAIGIPITFTDTEAGTPVTRLWSFVFQAGVDGTDRNPFAPAYPSTLVAPPTLGTPTAATATWTPTESGYYAIKLRREELPGVYDFFYLAIRVPDADGNALPSAGFNSALLNSDPETGYRGWGGTTTAPGQDAALRKIQTDIAALEAFDAGVASSFATLTGDVSSLEDTDAAFTVEFTAVAGAFVPKSIGDDATAVITGFVSNSHVTLQATTYTFADDTTIGGVGTVLYLPPGCKLRPASGKTLTIDCKYVALLTQVVFDLSSGGTVLLGVNSAQSCVTPQHFGWVTGGSDAGPYFNSALQAAAPAFVPLVIPPDTYPINTVVVVPSWARILGNPGVVLDAGLTPSGGSPTQVVFRGSFSVIRAAGALGVAAAIEDKTIVVTTDLANIGERIIVIPAGITNLGQMFTVIDKSGTVPSIVLTLDDPVEVAAGIGSAVQAIVPTEGVVITGNGMVLSGTGDRAIEFNCTESCLMEDMIIDGTGFDQMGGSFDIAGRRNRWLRMTVFGHDHCGGLGLESQNQSSMDDCEFHDCGKPGEGHTSIFVPDSTNFRISRVRIFGGQHGMLFDVGDAAAAGPAKGIVTDCEIIQPRLLGIQVLGGKDITFSNITLRNIATRTYTAGYTDGIVTDSSGTRSSQNIRFNNIAIEDISGIGLNLLGTNLHGTDIVVSGCQKTGVRVANDDLSNPSSAYLTNVSSKNNTERGLFLDGSPGNGSVCYVKNLTTASNVGAGAYLLGTGAGGGRLEVDGWNGLNDATGGLEGIWICSHDSGELRIANAAVTNSANGFWTGSVVAGRTHLSRFTATISGSPTGIKALADVAGAGILELAYVRTVGTLTFGVYSGHGVAASIRRGDAVDLSSCTTPWTIDATAAAGSYVSTSLNTHALTLFSNVMADPGDGGGVGVFALADRTTAPTTNPSGGGVAYSESGALVWRGSNGHRTVIGPNGTALGDSDSTFNPGTSTFWVLPSTTTITNNRTYTAGTTGISTGTTGNVNGAGVGDSRTMFVDIYNAATHTVAIVNGGTNGGTLITLSNATNAHVKLSYDAVSGDWVVADWWTL